MKNLINQIFIGLSILGIAVSCNQVPLPSHGEPKEDKDINAQIIGISRDTITVVKEFTYALHSTVYPDHAAAKEVLWSSLNEEVATVNDTGLVYGLEFGQTKVVLSLKDGGLTDTCVVNVLPNIHVESVTIDPAETDLILYEKIKLVANVYPANSRITDVEWATSDPEIATVDKRGNVEGLKEGTVTITATSVEGGKVGTCVVTVKRIPVTSVKLNVNEATLAPNGRLPLTASVEPADAHIKDVTWSSSDPSVAEVSPTGMVTAKSLGTALITVTTVDGGFIDNCFVTVEEPKNTRKLILTFDLSSCPESLKGLESNIPNGNYDFVADDGNAYSFEIFNGNTAKTTYSANGYLVVSTACYLGTPVIPGATLRSFTFTQGAGTNTKRKSSMASQTRTGGLKVDYYDCAEEAYLKSIDTATNGEDYKFTIMNPEAEKSYYYVTGRDANGLLQIVLEYDVEIKPLTLTFDLSSCPASLKGLESNIPNGNYDFVADDGNAYSFEIFKGNTQNASYSANGYLVINVAVYLGTPIISGRKLKTFTFTQGAGNSNTRKSSMASQTHTGGMKVDYYDCAEEAYNKSIVTGTKGEDYTFTIMNPEVARRYYYVTGSSGNGLSKVVLVYE